MGLFDRLFARAKQPSVNRQAIAMIMLAPDAAFDPQAAFQHLAKTWRGRPSIADVQSQDGATTASIPGGTLGLVHIPAPIPAGDLVGPIAVAWHWPDAAESIAQHHSHVIVLASSSALDALDLRILHTKLIAAILAVTSAVGVYVGDAMLVRSAEAYGEDAAAASRDSLPIISWIGFNCVSDDNTLSAYTTGLTGFGLPELEVRRSARPFPDMLGTLADIASYQLSSGRVLKDGDTFGATALDRSRVRYCPSDFIPDTTVALLELNEPAH